MGGSKVKTVLKLILFPISLVLSVLIYLLAFMLGIGTWVFNIISTLLVLGAIASFVTNEISLGIIALVLALLCSPIGLPKIGEKLVLLLGRLNGAIKAI